MHVLLNGVRCACGVGLHASFLLWEEDKKLLDACTYAATHRVITTIFFFPFFLINWNQRPSARRKILIHFLINRSR